ncbi:MAG: endolytic transglycosylase MltG [Pseudomonadota bacterium]|nr:endolytic transglycosylase MltG [Pseudomonadota bacterium]
MSGVRKRGGFLRTLFVVTALIAGFAVFLLWQRYDSFGGTRLTGIEAGETLVVEPGDSFQTVLRKLRKIGIGEGHELEWQALARQLGAAGKIQVGEYALAPGSTPHALLVAMRDGKVISYRFTIVEGWNIRELRAALTRSATLEQEGQTLDDAALMTTLGHAGQHPEGRFLPETYQYNRGDSDLDVLKRAHDAMAKALDAAWEKRAADIPVKSKEEALILASIVEKETGIASERPQIAGVFARRLKLGMLLQTDPTVIYGMGSAYAGNIRRQDLQTDTPYNTYTRAGLPPTPIAMPGADALNAATNPAAGDTLYFVAVGDGSGRHLFASTLERHNANVRAYVQRYRRQQSQ